MKIFLKFKPMATWCFLLSVLHLSYSSCHVHLLSINTQFFSLHMKHFGFSPFLFGLFLNLSLFNFVYLHIWYICILFKSHPFWFQKKCRKIIDRHNTKMIENEYKMKEKIVKFLLEHGKAKYNYKFIFVALT